ncbi:hypothetical protein ACFPLB_05770 [Aquamicrobium segne]|uniref:Uncharacterized protein n=1 Tax=Aquamicrobium segne TaxID=469547 RepID=A0ABW0GUY6_9HYPH
MGRNQALPIENKAHKRGVKTVLPLIVSFFMACTLVGSAHAGTRLPDGLYHCEVYLLGLFLNLGAITIKGNVYTPPSYFPVAQQGYNYQLESNGEIAWLGPLGGFTSGGNSISLTQVTSRDPENASFDIIMRHAQASFTAATCTKK